MRPTATTDEYEIYEPRLLYVTYLRGGSMISVVRSLKLDTGSEMYRPVIALTKGLEVFHQDQGTNTEMEGGQCQVTIYQCR